MSLTAEFYASVEAFLDQAFADAPDKSIRGYFCDGVLGPEWEADYLPAYVKTTKQIIVRAWIDAGKQKNQKATQHLYTVVLKLGPQTLVTYLANHALGTSLHEQDGHWFQFALEAKTITIQLI